MRSVVLAGGILVGFVVSALVAPLATWGQTCEPMSLTECKVRIRFRRSADGTDRFRVVCKHLTLGGLTNGIDPVGEGLTFELQDSPGSPCFSETIAPGDILRKSSAWQYKSANPSLPGIRHLRLRQSKKDLNDHKLAVKSRSANIQCISSAPVIGITIGDDCGTKACVLRSGTVYDCP